MPDKWVVSSPPYAVLSPIDKDPVPSVNGATVQRYSTRFNAWWCRVVERTGFTYWMRLVKG